MVVLGKIVGPYGLRGAVKVFPFADDPAAWAGLPNWWLGPEKGRLEDWKPTRLISCKDQGEVLVAMLACFPDRNASENAKGLLVGVPRGEMPQTAENEYYWADLIGLEVVNLQDCPLGRVLGLIETSANDVLRVGDGEAPERLLPFVASVVLDVDRVAKRIRVDWGADW